MEKDLSITELFDIYGNLLTAKQREMFSSYYLYDLSLSEIAEPYGTTRQSVSEQVKKVVSKLKEYESILHIKEKNDKLKQIANSSTDKLTKQKLNELIGK